MHFDTDTREAFQDALEADDIALIRATAEALTNADEPCSDQLPGVYDDFIDAMAGQAISALDSIDYPENWWRGGTYDQAARIALYWCDWCDRRQARKANAA